MAAPADPRAHDPSRMLEVAPGVLGTLTTTDSNDPSQSHALRMWTLDRDDSGALWQAVQAWPFGTVIPGVEEWHLPWMEEFGYRRDNGFDEYHRELAVIAPSFYRPNVAYFSLWNEPGAEAAAGLGEEPAMYHAIYRANAVGAFPNQQWVMEPAPVYYSDTGTARAGMPRAIDPHVWDDVDGSMYMTFGSWDPEGSAVIHIADMNPATGRIRGTDRDEPGYWDTVEPGALHPVATFGEAAFSIRSGDYYYLFVNLGACCSGVDSTYRIVVGRSTSVFGPYRDHLGRSFMDRYDYDADEFPGRSVLAGEDRFIGPGHTGLFEGADGELLISYHYYDGEAGGISKLGVRILGFDAEGWPRIADASGT